MNTQKNAEHRWDKIKAFRNKLYNALRGMTKQQIVELWLTKLVVEKPYDKAFNGMKKDDLVAMKKDDLVAYVVSKATYDPTASYDSMDEFAAATLSNTIKHIFDHLSGARDGFTAKKATIVERIVSAARDGNMASVYSVYSEVSEAIELDMLLTLNTRLSDILVGVANKSLEDIQAAVAVFKAQILEQYLTTVPSRSTDVMHNAFEEVKRDAVRSFVSTFTTYGFLYVEQALNGVWIESCRKYREKLDTLIDLTIVGGIQ